MRVLVLLLAALLAVPAVARAQTSDTRNRALIVLDASKSMNEDAGNGGTRLDAAKKAVGTLVDRLPEGVPLGLRVYGSKVSEVSRAEGCQDTELTVPVGPLDKSALTSTVNALQGKGRTPIGRSRGQTAAEYVGVLLVVSVIIAAVAATDLGHDITHKLSDLVRDISGGDSGKK